MAHDQTDVLLRSLIKLSEETAEHCKFLKDILAQSEVKIFLKDSDSIRLTKWASMAADVHGTGLGNFATTDIAAINQDIEISASSLIPLSIVTVSILQIVQLILVLYLGRNAAKAIILIGNQFYPTAIILLALAEFMILLSCGAFEESLSKAQAESKLPRQHLKTYKMLEISLNLALVILLWPWYSLWSASSKH